MVSHQRESYNNYNSIDPIFNAFLIRSPTDCRKLLILGWTRDLPLLHWKIDYRQVDDQARIFTSTQALTALKMTMARHSMMSRKSHGIQSNVAFDINFSSLMLLRVLSMVLLAIALLLVLVDTRWTELRKKWKKVRWVNNYGINNYGNNPASKVFQQQPQSFSEPSTNGSIG